MFSRWLWRLQWDLWSGLDRTEADSMGSILLGRLLIAFMVLELVIGVQFLFVELGVDTFASITSSLGFGFGSGSFSEETSFISLPLSSLTSSSLGVSGLAFGFLYSDEGFELDASCIIGDFGSSS